METINIAPEMLKYRLGSKKNIYILIEEQPVQKFY